MRVLVTGGAGFVPSHLCDLLLREGHHVTCVDNFCTGRRENVRHLLGRSDFQLIEHDIIQPLDLEADAVFHMASPASPVDFKTMPVEIMLVNSIGTLNALEIARKSGGKFLMASTSEAYGDPLEHPQKETYRGNVSSLGPRSCYDESKRFAEALSMTYVRKHDTDARVIRIFNTYGPRMRPDDGRVVPNLISQALSGEALTVYGDGSQTRSFCYVEDLVAGISRAMFAPGTKGEVFNLGNPSERPILQFAEAVRELVNPELPIVHEPLPVDDPTRRRPDITKAKATLGWEPAIALEEGLKRTIDYFRGKPARGA